MKKLTSSRYLFPLIVASVVSLVFLLNNQIGLKALTITGSSFLEMLSVIPPIFILLGLLDVWIPKRR